MFCEFVISTKGKFIYKIKNLNSKKEFSYRTIINLQGDNLEILIVIQQTKDSGISGKKLILALLFLYFSVYILWH